MITRVTTSTIHKLKIKSLLGAALLSVLSITALIGFSASAQAQQIELKFNSLPSMQGWTYEHVGNNLAETTVFRNSRGVLHQDTVTPGLFGGGDHGSDNLYKKDGVVSTTNHFSITVKAKLLRSTARPGGGTGCGFAFGANTGPNGNDESYAVCLDETFEGLAVLWGGKAIAGPPNAASFDKAKEHLYRLDVWPGIAATLSVDGALRWKSGVVPWTAFGAPHDEFYPRSLFFGDGTGTANAEVDISQFVYSEDPCGQLNPAKASAQVIERTEHRPARLQ